ncbi:conserved hypothetical protein [Neospora caninum Liverpool]|uniref:Uncharacterized protein n=1 Tax=Neospora caninum (strain Liverpool) TaxID=572307 RepID=F0VNH3_NEOCL|nr:conserved hypothetical protein [Neospora caninum Liverpool]CBZ55269.1 conserved hypothetical protein [Neospora caninum Liverpool]CEL69999.1 TPA: hypothetical protein BN1204_056930 [Neospora caninum Liverpool]|eukprot:XP_003885297.1 conserved hypothetical protein [Neospora caninum Liverpool]
MKERKSAAVIAVLFLVWNIAVTLTLPQIDIFAEENQEPPLDSIFYVSPVTDATQDPTRVQTEETDTDSQELIRRTRVAATDPKTVPSPPAAEPKTIPSSPATDPKTISSSPATDPKTIPSSPEAEPRTAPSPPVTEPKPVPRPRTNGPKPGKKSQDLKEDVRRLAEMLKHLHGGDMWHVFLKLEGTINKTASRPAIRLAHEYSRESLQETRLCRTAARLARLSTMLVAAKLTSYEQELSAAAHQLATAKVAMARAADFPDVRPKVILPSEKSLRKLERGFLIQKKDLRLASELARHAYALFTRHEAKAILSFLSLEEEALEFRALYLQSRLEALKADLEAVKGLEKHGTENQGPPYGVLTESELSSLRDTAESLIRQAVLKGAFLQEPTIAAGLAFVFSYDAPEPDFLQTSEFLDEVADDVVRLSEAVTKFANRS